MVVDDRNLYFVVNGTLNAVPKAGGPVQRVFATEEDGTYPIDGVRAETDAVTAAGFPMRRIEVDGGHWDDAGAIENGHAVPGTAADLQTYLLPELDAGWTAP